MQFSAILCLATYDWFCADGLHLSLVKLKLRLIVFSFQMMNNSLSTIFFEWENLSSSSHIVCVEPVMGELGSLTKYIRRNIRIV